MSKNSSRRVDSSVDEVLAAMSHYFRRLVASRIGVRDD